MLNTSQNLDSWQKFFGTPSGSQLGLMNAVYQIGSLASFPFVYVIPKQIRSGNARIELQNLIIFRDSQSTHGRSLGPKTSHHHRVCAHDSRWTFRRLLQGLREFVFHLSKHDLILF